eukprot:Gb_40687 [translate_table: standard]
MGSRMAMRMVSQRLGARHLARRAFSDGQGKILSEEEKAAENIYIKESSPSSVLPWMSASNQLILSSSNYPAEVLGDNTIIKRAVENFIVCFGKVAELGPFTCTSNEST